MDCQVGGLKNYKMSHSDGGGWLSGQPAAINSKYVYGHFVQRVPEYVRNRFSMILGVILSPPANHSLLFWYSVPVLKICIARQDFSESCLLILANVLESVPMTETLNRLADAIAFLGFQLTPNLEFFISGVHPSVNASLNFLGAPAISSC